MPQTPSRNTLCGQAAKIRCHHFPDPTFPTPHPRRPRPGEMANFRRFRPEDLNKLSKCNLDPLTETYELGFYLQYYAKWPSLFQVAEDQYGNIIGYSELGFANF